jgi:hypothetical protein
VSKNFTENCCVNLLPQPRADHLAHLLGHRGVQHLQLDGPREVQRVAAVGPENVGPRRLLRVDGGAVVSPAIEMELLAQSEDATLSTVLHRAQQPVGVEREAEELGERESILIIRNIRIFFAVVELSMGKGLRRRIYKLIRYSINEGFY